MHGVMPIAMIDAIYGELHIALIGLPWSPHLGQWGMPKLISSEPKDWFL
jgi:hypothetical protein